MSILTRRGRIWQLYKAHRALDAAVDKAYGRKFKAPSSPLRGSAEAGDADRVAHLFELYKKADGGETSPL